MQLYEATRQDEEIVYSFVCMLEATIFDREVFHDSWTQVGEDTSITYYLLREGDVYVGLCSLRFVLHLHHCDMVAQMEEFIVDTTYRHQGYGTYMFYKIKEIAIQKGCHHIECSSHEKRCGAHAFYEQVGMKKQHYKFTLPL